MRRRHRAGGGTCLPKFLTAAGALGTLREQQKRDRSHIKKLKGDLAAVMGLDMQTVCQAAGYCRKDTLSTAEQPAFPTAWISLADLR